LEFDQYPFYPNGTPLMPSHTSKFRSSDNVVFYIYCRNNISNTYSPVFTLTSDDETAISIEPPVFHQPFPYLEDFQVIPVELKLPQLKPGKYILHSKLNENDNGGSETVFIITED
jgi:hypothetical protein